MIVFLLVVSFILHAISFLVIILLYLQWSKVKEVEKRQAQLIKDIEHTVSAYLVEWKEENDRFLNALSEAVNQPADEVITSLSKSPSSEPEQSLPPHSNTATPSSKTNTHSSSQTVAPVEQEWSTHLPNIEAITDKVEIGSSSSIAERVIQLHKNGKTIEEIAKILKKGKTEIELLLKFRQR
ncbi:hypothetical protein [Thermaerobacillus caldiproteolyticus]|uniref:hypothetical protein n=1 Tax=Thermaerobacillus caldiproteolyticus TaxID=247480 RepID=UPI0018F25171|nr:hypothetical protein [Anoxybacillus caldiproteolyticus]